MPIDDQGNLYVNPADLDWAWLKVPADLGALVPADYWATGAPIAPEAALDRLAHYDDLAALADADTSRASGTTAAGVQPNYWGRAATFMGELFSMFPPRISNIDPRISQPLERAMAEARTLATVLYNAIVTGTGVHHLRIAKTNRAVIRPIPPSRWFPAASQSQIDDGEWADAHLEVGGEGDNRWAKVTIITPGRAETRRFGFDGERLGELLAADTATSSQTRPLFAVPMLPLTGQFGRSPLVDLTSAAVEMGRIFSRNAITLERYSSPMLTVTGRLSSRYGAEGPDEQRRLQAKAAILAFDDGRREPVWPLPEGVDSVGYVSWDAQMQASFSHFDRVESAMYAMSALPFGLGQLAELLASGASLRRLWLPTYALLESLRVLIGWQIADACAAAAEMHDQPAIDPADVEIDWPNPLEAVDEQRIVQGNPETMGDPADPQPAPGDPE